MSPLVRQPLTVEHALLGFLREQPMHGYEIHQQLTAPTGLGLVWQVKQSHLYAILDKLEAEGFIAGSQEIHTPRPPRLVFHLTGPGRQALDDWLGRPVLHGRDFRIEFMAKLYFAQRAGPERVEQLVQAQREVCLGWQASLQAEAEAAAGPDGEGFAGLVYQYRLGQTAAMIAWLDQCAEKLWTP